MRHNRQKPKQVKLERGVEDLNNPLKQRMDEVRASIISTYDHLLTVNWTPCKTAEVQ